MDIDKKVKEFENKFPNMDTLHLNIFKLFLRQALEEQKKEHSETLIEALEEHKKFINEMSTIVLKMRK